MKKLIAFHLGLLDWAGLIITATYFYYLFTHLDMSEIQSTLGKPEKLSGFLGGIFAPLAFFWLVIGNITISRNQNKSFRWLENEKRMEISSIQPEFKLSNSIFAVRKSRYGDTNLEKDRIIIKIKNISEPARNIKIRVKNSEFEYDIETLYENKSHEAIIETTIINGLKINNSYSIHYNKKNNNTNINFTLEIEYQDKIKAKRIKEYKCSFILAKEYEKQPIISIYPKDSPDLVLR